MKAMIWGLDDTRAIRVLSMIAGARLRGGSVAPIGWSAALGRVLRDGFGVGPTPRGSISPGDLAREALLVLADDPAERPAIAVLGVATTPEPTDPPERAAVLAAALVVLQTRVEIERTERGRWRLADIQRPAGSAPLEPLVEKILGLGMRN